MELSYLIGFLAGCIPYHIETRTHNDNRLITLRAVFWNYHYLSLSDGRRYLVVQVSIVEKLQSAIWSIVRHFAPTAGPPPPTNSLAHLLFEAKETPSTTWEVPNEY